MRVRGEWGMRKRQLWRMRQQAQGLRPWYACMQSVTGQLYCWVRPRLKLPACAA
jgi:hypothetical protein